MERKGSQPKLTDSTAEHHAAEHLSPCSFVDIDFSTLEDSPPPKPIPFSDLVKLADTNMSMERRLEDFELESNNNLKLVNKEIISAQKKVLPSILKQLATKVWNMKKIVGMSLKIDIFQPRSMIERTPEMFRFFPYYCEKACETESVSERVRLVTCALVGSMQYQLDQWKPFNPILGETYQAKLGQHTDLSMEHICHHPAISQFLVSGRGWRATGSFIFAGKIGANKVTIYYDKWFNVEFDDGVKLEVLYPGLRMGGLIFGSRKMSYTNCLVVKCVSAGIKSVLKFNPKHKKKKKFLGLMNVLRYHDIEGKLYVFNPDKEAKTMKKKWSDTQKAVEKMNDIAEEIEPISGNWLKNLVFGESEYWNAADYGLASAQVPVEDKFALPSSYRFREDLAWLQYENKKHSQFWKHLLENQQRSDRKHREEGYKARAKKKGGKKGFFSRFRRN